MPLTKRLVDRAEEPHTAGPLQDGLAALQRITSAAERFDEPRPLFVSNEEIAALRALTDAVERMQWRPIETAPKDFSDADLWVLHPQHGGMRAANMQWDAARHRWRDWMGMPLNPGWEPTHWMPLPPPPATEGER